MAKAKKEYLQFRTIRGISVNYRWIMSTYVPHYHSAGEFIVALDDNCRYKVEGQEITLMKNDILLVWPNEVHETINVERNSSMIVHFSQSLMDHNLDLITASDMLSNCHKIDSVRYPDLAEKIAQRMFDIRDMYDNKTFFSESKCKIKMLEIIVLIGEHIFSEQQDQRVATINSTSDKKHIQAALTYIDEHFSDNISQQDVAEYVGLSPYYFSRLFKKYMKKNISAYISDVRIRNAIGLLADDNMSVTDCAFRSGFQSITAFNRVFREVIGCSPREYKKNSIKRNKMNI